MTLILQRLFAAALVLFMTAPLAAALPDRTPPVFDKWSVGCGNSGMCFTSTFVRDQATWVDIRIVRDWRADAEPLLRLTTNAALAADGTLKLTVDGAEIEALPVAQLREIQGNVVPPPGFRPIGGEGFWFPTGPVTREIVDTLAAGQAMIIDMPGTPEPVAIQIPLNDLRSALEWIDDRQARTGTLSAMVMPGTEPAVDAPHAMSLVAPETLPPAVATVWDANRFCSDIDPAIFAGLDAIVAPLEDKSSLYLLPCGAPSAYNTPYVAIHASPDGKARQVYVARMSDKGPVASDLIYNARWVPGRLELQGLFKGSGLGECGIWDRWVWTGTTFVLIEEATRQTCDGGDVPLAAWDTSWPAVTSHQ